MRDGKLLSRSETYNSTSGKIYLVRALLIITMRILSMDALGYVYSSDKGNYPLESKGDRT